MNEDVTYCVLCGLYTGEKDYLTSSEWHRKTQSYLRKRLTKISGEISEQTKRQRHKKPKRSIIWRRMRLISRGTFPVKAFESLSLRCRDLHNYLSLILLTHFFIAYFLIGVRNLQNQVKNKFFRRMHGWGTYVMKDSTIIVKSIPVMEKLSAT